MRTISFQSGLLILMLIATPSWGQNTPDSDSSVVSVPMITGTKSMDEPDFPGAEPEKKGDVPPVETTVTIEETTVVTQTVDPGFLKVQLPRLAARGPNLVSASLGLRAGLSDDSPGGFLFSVQYAWQVSRAFWLDSQFSTAIGGRCDATSSIEDPTACGGLSGFGADLLVGVMMQFLNWPHWDLPLNPYARVLTGVSFIISNGPHDGAAIVVRGAGGLRYSFTDEFAVGAELGLMIGPSFRNHVGSGAYASFDFLFSAEYSF